MGESPSHLMQSTEASKLVIEQTTSGTDQNFGSAPLINTQTYLLAREHASLRNEILKRIKIRQQLVALTLIVAGTFLSIGLQPNAPIALLTIYSILSTFLWASWLHNDLRVGQMVVYVRDVLEKQFGVRHIGWENFARAQFLRATPRQKARQPRRPETYARNVLVTRGVFLSTQSLAVHLSIAQEVRVMQQTDVGTDPIGFFAHAFTSPHFDLVFINLPLILCDFFAIGFTFLTKRWRG